MENNIKGKVIIITGASSGIGGVRKTGRGGDGYRDAPSEWSGGDSPDRQSRTPNGSRDPEHA